MRFRRLTPDNEWRLHLAKAREYWLADRLDLANAAMQNALRVGLPASDWYDLQRTIEAEWAVRQGAERRRIAEHLILEAHPARWGRYLAKITEIACRALVEVTETLAVNWGRPVLLTLFPSSDWVEFLHARYGYFAARAETHKICLPPQAVDPPSMLRRAARHEMAHAATHQLAGETAPRWLDEGLAVLLEGGASLQERRQVRYAARRGQRMTLDEISGGFESYALDLDSPGAALCYALAGDFVGRLAAAHGLGALRALLLRLGGGQRPDRAFRDVFGLPLRQAERGWEQGRAIG